ncbi:MAG: hypothetical protein AAB906_02255 [Patescibacteria group bacterium]
MHYKLAQLILRGAEKKTGTTSDIHIAQPDSEKENLAGKLFFLIEIESKTASDLKMIDFLIQNIEHNYYQNEKLVLREKNQNIKIEHIFELAIAKTNKNLNDFLQSEKIDTDLSLINALVGIIHENDLYFSSIGKPKAFLIYKENPAAKSKNNNRAACQEKQCYKLINIIDHTKENENGPINQAKIFSNIISGTIPVGGYFVFTNEAVSEYLTGKQMTEIVTTLPPAGAVEQIRNILSQINSYVSFLGIVIKNTYGSYELEPKKEIITSSTHASISNLNNVEESTEKFLAPGGYVSFRKILGRLIKNGRKNPAPIGGLKDKIIFKRKPSFIFAYVFGAIRIFFSYAFSLIIFISKTASNKENLFNLLKNIKSQPGLMVGKARALSFAFRLWLKDLSRMNKILFGITFGCLIILIFNINFLNFKNKKIEREKNINSIVREIEQKQNQIEADLLYDNESEIKKLLPEIKDLLGKLPQTDKNYSILSDKYDGYLEKIRHAVKLDKLQEIALIPSENTDLKNLTMDGNKLYAAGHNSIFALDLADSKVSSVKTDAANLEKPTLDKNGNIYYFDDKKVVIYNTKNQQMENAAINTRLADLKGAVSFNGKLYIIDGNEIYSLAKKGPGFERTKWLKENISLDDAVSMDIDGNIYALRSDGELIKLLKGRQENFALEDVEPAINNPAKLIARTDNNFIYILEPSQKRIIVFDKNGKFFIQYTTDKEIKDFAVDEKNKTFYILSGSSVYKSGF